MSIYSSVPIRKPKRNVFNLSHSFKGMLNIGEITPICRPIECIPYDTFITGNISKVELSPVITDFQGELYFETWQFFVSNDMLYNYSKDADDSAKFSEILVSLSDPQEILPLPRYLKGNSINYSSRWFAYLGYKQKHVNKGPESIKYPARALNKIYNDWFRDENLQEEKYFEDYGNKEYLINYKKDRFTSAFLSTQKGVELKIKTPVNLTLNDAQDTLTFQGHVSADYLHNLQPYGYLSQNSALFSVSDTSLTEQQQINFAKSLGKAVIRNVDAALNGLSINDLRLYNRLQRWLEKLQLIGTRTKEYLLGNYGIAPNDETLERPVLIGHTRVPVVVDPIISNIKNTNQTSISMQNYQGSRGGVAGASSSFRYGKWLCKEFGWIITLGCLRPKATYYQGIHRSLTRTHVVDYYNEIFSHLGQQPVYEYEINATVTLSAGQLEDVFGYQDIYNELRHLEDYASFDLVTNYPQKLLCRKFNSAVVLNSDFIQVNPSEYDYLFAVAHTAHNPTQSGTVAHATFNSYNVIKAIRPIPKRSIPSL